MDTIGARHLGQCLLEMVYRFSIAALRDSHLPQPVVSSCVVLINIQCRAETLLSIFQTVQFEKDVSEVHVDGNVVRPQGTRELVATDRVIEAAFLLVQLCKQVDPTKV